MQWKANLRLKESYESTNRILGDSMAMIVIWIVPSSITLIEVVEATNSKKLKNGSMSYLEEIIMP